MREIKFKAWDRANGCWLDNIFIENDGSVWSNQDVNGYDLLREEFSISVVQHTGLKDKNGIEIYERDIVSEINPANGKNMGQYEVKSTYMGGYSPFEYDGGGECIVEWCEVIGNIYENSELLN